MSPQEWEGDEDTAEGAAHLRTKWSFLKHGSWTLKIRRDFSMELLSPPLGFSPCVLFRLSHSCSHSHPQHIHVPGYPRTPTMLPDAFLMRVGPTGWQGPKPSKHCLQVINCLIGRLEPEGRPGSRGNHRRLHEDLVGGFLSEPCRNTPKVHDTWALISPRGGQGLVTQSHH